jgi:hypothetical protein
MVGDLPFVIPDRRAYITGINQFIDARDHSRKVCWELSYRQRAYLSMANSMPGPIPRASAAAIRKAASRGRLDD